MASRALNTTSLRSARQRVLPKLVMASLTVLLSLPSAVRAEGQQSALATGASDAFRSAWREAGLTELEAVVHAVDRLGFGARPGTLEEIASLGLAPWLEKQLAPPAKEPEVEAALAHLDTLGLSSRQLAETFPNPGMVAREMRAMESGGDGRRASGRAGGDGSGTTRKRRPSPQTEAPERPQGADAEDPTIDRRAMREYLDAQGYRPRHELTAQLLTQKLIRATETAYPLQEMLVDFWFNHFNVSVRDPEGGGQVLAYERDAIRPHVLSEFRTLLEATARHPAMLGYLDNASSRAEPGQRTALTQQRGASVRGRGAGGIGMRGGGRGSFGAGGMRGGRQGGMRPDTRNPGSPTGPDRGNAGLNENYARELLELHTLGVDGGYTQADVVEVARAFTGWTMVPPRILEERLGRGSMMDRVGATGFVLDGLFLFHPGFHDAEKKRVLGHRLPAGRGIEDGLAVLDIVASHPSTARHLSTKFATRFVSDDPPGALVDALAQTFSASGGDLGEWTRTLLSRPEFWASRGDKVRTPFEYVAASIRALDGEFRRPSRELFGAMEAMGQLPYSYDAPTGFPDEADHWLSSGALLARMNFATSLVQDELGVKLDPRVRDLAESAFDRGGLPAALESVVEAVMPGRPTESTVKQLEPLVTQFEGESGLVESMVAWTLGSPEFQQR